MVLISKSKMLFGKKISAAHTKKKVKQIRMK